MEKEIEVFTSMKPAGVKDRIVRKVLTGIVSPREGEYLEIWVNDRLVHTEDP